MEPSVQLIVCVFDGAARADEVYREIRSLDRRLDEIKLGNIAVVRKSADGQVTISETYELKTNRSLIGSLPLVGMLVGVVAERMHLLPVSRRAAVVIGGGLGLLAGTIISAVDFGFPDEPLQQIGPRLTAGQSAIVMLVQPGEEKYVYAKLTELGGMLIQGTLPPELIAELTAPRQMELMKRQLSRPWAEHSERE